MLVIFKKELAPRLFLNKNMHLPAIFAKAHVGNHEEIRHVVIYTFWPPWMKHAGHLKTEKELVAPITSQ